MLDVLGGSLDGKRENLDSYNEKQRTANSHDEGIMFDGEFERIMFDDKRRASSKLEEEGAPQLAEFCRLCYCRLDFYPCDLYHIFTIIIPLSQLGRDLNGPTRGGGASGGQRSTSYRALRGQLGSLLPSLSTRVSRWAFYMSL